MDIKKILSRILDVLLICLILFLAFRILQQKGIIKTKLEDMEKIPSFQGQSFNGKVIDNSIFKDKDYTIINIWSPMCGACIEEMDAFIELEDYIEETEGQIIGIGINSTKAMAKKIVKEKNLSYINMMNNFKMNKDFVSGAVLTPTNIIVDRDGNVLELSVGSYGKNGDIDYFKKLIDKIKK